ncbi:MAG: fatty acid desaturase [Pirellulaceae bacterium]|nr:fatty acid desaturase [Pirellulaceae bacterium]
MIELPQAAPALDPRIARLLRPSNLLGAIYVSFASSTSLSALLLSLSDSTALWLLGQMVWAISFLQWFSILHEAGHKTLFATPLANRLVGHMSGWMAVIPFDTWKLIHARHHHWTGWQDLDATTQQLVPRPLRRWEKLSVNICWATGLPLFSTLYRASNYWNLPRLFGLYPDPQEHRRIAAAILGYGLIYGLVMWLVGPLLCIKLFGLGLLLTLMLQDPLILSQHTHVPMRLSHGGDVKPIPPRQQQFFTRSLVFPTWFGRWILLNLDAHELHHMYASVPGYFLHRLSQPTPNAMPWWLWLWRAKQIRGDVLLFHNRDETGYLI